MQQTSEVPEGWVFAKLGDVCSIVSGKTPPNVNNLQSGGDIPFYKISDMNSPSNKVYMYSANLCLNQEYIENTYLQQ